MGMIKEPLDVDFYVDPSPLTKKEMDAIHKAIAFYNETGKIMVEPNEQQRIATSLAKKGKRNTNFKTVVS